MTSVAAAARCVDARSRLNRGSAASLGIATAIGCLAALTVGATSALPKAQSHRPPHSPDRVQGHAGTRVPLGLVQAASANIGTSDRGYWPMDRNGSLVTAGGHIRGAFSVAGATLRVPHGTLDISLAAVARGRRVEPVTAVAPTRDANEVVYRHGAVTELYRNGPYGVEQAFTIPRRPSGGGSLVLEIGLRGSLRPEQAGSEVRFSTRSGAVAFRYSGLAAADATHRAIPAKIALHGERLYLLVDDRAAHYPLQIDPLVQQGEKLTAEGEVGEGGFGMRVALSSDGNTALIGAGHDNSNVGAAWVFTRSGSTWTQQGSKLTGSGETGNAHLGEAVALSGAGNIAFVGGPRDNTEKGAVWVFTRSGSTWTQQGAKITGSGESGEGYFGSSVALAADGKTALVGAPSDNPRGAVWVFTREGSTWTQQGEKLTGGEGTFGFGSSLALSEEGNTGLIGSTWENSGHGAGWVFTRSESTWTQQQKLTATGESGAASLGASVAVSADGNTALLGAPLDNEQHGAAWVFTRAAGKWTQQGEKLVGNGGTSLADFGASVALSSSGNAALIGGPYDSTRGGAAWVFTRSGSSWTQQGEKLTASLYSGSFGASLALSADGNTAFVGSPSGVGAAWPFSRGPAVFTGSASSVTATSATLNATVNPNGSSTECHFEYGTSTAYGASISCPTGPGAGETPVTESVSIAGLSTSTPYHFRVAATNSFGTSYGADRTFTPSAETAEGGAFTPGFSPNSRLGEGATSTAGFTFEGSGYDATAQNPKGGIPPLTKLAVHLPLGVGISTAGFPICTQEVLQNAGASGCPSGSIAGPVTSALWEVTFGTERVPEQTTVQPFFAPNGVNVYVVGRTPVSLEAILRGTFATDSSPYGTALTIQIPPIATVPGAPLASMSQLTLGFGAVRHEGGTAIYSLTVPPSCPAGGFSWAADETFGGSEAGIPETDTHLTAQTPCAAPAGGPPSAPPVSAPPVAPTLTAVSQSRRTWREGSRSASFARVRRPPLGTVFSFALNENASIGFAFTQLISGRRVKGKCVVQTKKNRRRPSCRRMIVAGSLAFTARAGTDRVSFQGRLSRKKKLKPGTYTLVIVATNTAGQRSAPKQLSFTIVK